MKRLAISFVTLGMTATLASPSFATKSYYIDQLVNYPSPCTQATLFDDTSAIKSRMDTESWSGLKFTDSAAWAKDFREHCSSTYGSEGLDSLYADAQAVSIFSGHGSPGALYFGTQRDTCTLNIDNEARLGSMSGATSAVAMYISCQTLSKDASGAPTNGGSEWL